MDKIFWEISIVFLLTLLNGFFSMSEIALISVRKTRIASLAKQGNQRAKIVQELHKNPESLFATIQVGISVITIFASAFAGASIAERFSGVLENVSYLFISNNAYAISFVVVVAVLSYVSVVLGELVPKSLGLRYAEKFSLLAAYPIWWESKISFWPIKLLSSSANFILKFFKDSTSFLESRLSKEEIRAVLIEGRNAGTIKAHEHGLLENIFDFSNLTVEKIMVPRTQMVAFDINEPARSVVHKAIESGYSRIPIYQGNLNTIVGVLYTKKLLGKFDNVDKNFDIHDYLLPPYFVPTAMKISEVLQRLQRKKVQVALVTNERGEVEGLVTLEDILEEIVGDITDETDEVSQAIEQVGDTHKVAGDVSVVDFNKHFHSALPEDKDFNTVSGFILDRLERFPKAGDEVLHEDMVFTVQEITLRTIKKVIVKHKNEAQ
ncbi:MAG: hemolysin family protein [Patescibacteria group bacterium]